MRRLAHLVPIAIIVAPALLVCLFGPGAPGRMQPTLAFCAPSAQHPFGCGEGGVDLLPLVASALVRGVGLAAGVAAVGFAIGTPLGAAAALAQGAFERTVVRACDLVQAFPTFLFALAVLSAVRTPTRVHLAIVFALTAWAPFARLALAETRVVRGAVFVEAARALGASPARVIVRHILPSLLGVATVQLGSTASAIVVSEAALAFLGFGPRDGCTLGGVLDQGTSSMLRAPHVLIVGALAVGLTSAALLVAGRAAAASEDRGAAERTRAAREIG